MKLRRIAVTLIAGLALTVFGTGCFGKFAATRGLYNFNKSLSSNKFVQTIVMWGLIIIPAYELFALGDFLIFNTIEFWTGSNVLSMGDIEEGPDGTVRMVRGDDVYELRQLDKDAVSVSKNGAPMGTATRMEDGSLALFDDAGQLLRLISAGEVETAATLPQLQGLAAASVR